MKSALLAFAILWSGAAAAQEVDMQPFPEAVVYLPLGGGTITGALKLNDDVQLQIGSAPRFWWYYDSANSRLALKSTDSDGGGTDGDVLRIANGGLTVLFLAGHTFGASSVLLFGGNIQLDSSGMQMTGGSYNAWLLQAQDTKHDARGIGSADGSGEKGFTAGTKYTDAQIATASGTGFVHVFSVSTDADGTPSEKLWVSDTGKITTALGTSANTVVLAADVTDSSGNNTYTDCTGLSFAVTSGVKYGFRAMIYYTAAATTTGSAWSINGPGSPTFLGYKSWYGLTTASETTNFSVFAYDSPATANATSPTQTAAQLNQAWIEGFIVPSGNGTVIVRFATEVDTSAIVCKAGSSITYWF